MIRYCLIFSQFLIFGQFAFPQPTQLTGKVSDQSSQQALEFASVSLYAVEDSNMVNGTLTDSAGTFQFEKVKPGRYYIEIRFMGYESRALSDLLVEAGTPFLMGEIGLVPTELLLEEVEISGRKIATFHTADRQVYNMEKYQNDVGGNAADLINYLPSVYMDARGQLSVRGSQDFIILLDGKQIQTDPSVLLKQIPANAIAKVEIITTPSARFDPDGKAGIINVILQKGAWNGWYISSNLQGGLPSVEAYDNKEAARRFGADVTVNYKQTKWDVAAGLDYRRNDIGGRRVGYVNTYQNEILTEFPSYGERSFDRENYSGRLSVQYTPSAKHSLGASFYAGKRTQFRTADILYDFQQRTMIPEGEFLGTDTYWELYEERGEVFDGGTRQDSLTFFNENLRVRRGDFLIGSVDYTVEISDNSKLEFSALYEHTILGGPTDNNSLAWPNTTDTLQLQFNDNLNPLDGLRLNVDITQKVGQNTWTSGYQFRFLNHPGDFEYLDRDLKAGIWEINPTFTNRIELRRQIHSMYSQLAGTKDRWTYNLGLRLEYMNREVTTADPDSTYLLNLINPFPSISVSYQLGGNLFLKGGYSRRIQRTTTFKMTPFPEREHSETLEQGDAELLPEFIDQAELGLVSNWGDNSVFLTGYYRHARNVINRVNTIYNDSILNRIYTNAGNAQVWGVEVGANLYPVNIWSLALGANVYNYRIRGELFGDQINTANTIFSINANTTVQLLPTLDLQLGLNYLSQRVTAQGVDSRFYNPSLSLRKTFFKKQLTASLQWQSIDMGLLSSNEQRITTVRDNFYTTTNYVYEVDILMLGISYQLNQPSKKVKLIKSEFGDKEF